MSHTRRRGPPAPITVSLQDVVDLANSTGTHPARPQERPTSRDLIDRMRRRVATEATPARRPSDEIDLAAPQVRPTAPPVRPTEQVSARSLIERMKRQNPTPVQKKEEVVVRKDSHPRDTSSKRIDDDRCEFHAKGVRCPARKTRKHFCPFHREPSAPEPVKDNCPVCLDDHMRMKWFPCSHGLCYECLGSLHSVEVEGTSRMLCPVCRADIEHVLSSTEKQSIDQNTRKSRREAQRELQIMSERRARELVAQDEEGSFDDDYSGEVEDFGGLVDNTPLAGMVRGAFMVLRRGQANANRGRPSWLL